MHESIAISAGFADLHSAATLPDAAPQPTEEQFDALRTRYQSTGGVAAGDDLARLLDDHRCGDFVSLARLISCNEIFAFAWHGSFWVPMFQFDLRDMTSRSAPQQVRGELADEYAGWALAAWFAEPSRWLNGRAPVQSLESDLVAVLAAARADRFIAAG